MPTQAEIEAGAKAICNKLGGGYWPSWVPHSKAALEAAEHEARAASQPVGETHLTDALIDALTGRSVGSSSVRSVQTFSEAGLSTPYAGLVVEFYDDSQFRITVVKVKY